LLPLFGLIGGSVPVLGAGLILGLVGLFKLMNQFEIRAKTQGRQPRARIVALTGDRDGAGSASRAGRSRSVTSMLAAFLQATGRGERKLRPALQATLRELRRARRLVVSDLEIMGGDPVFRGTRVPVHMIAELVAQGSTQTECCKVIPGAGSFRGRAIMASQTNIPDQATSTTPTTKNAIGKYTLLMVPTFGTSPTAATTMRAMPTSK
jgi:Protein of unknown function (DUF433)